MYYSGDCFVILMFDIYKVFIYPDLYASPTYFVLSAIEKVDHIGGLAVHISWQLNGLTFVWVSVYGLMLQNNAVDAVDFGAPFLYWCTRPYCCLCILDSMVSMLSHIYRA